MVDAARAVGIRYVEEYVSSDVLRGVLHFTEKKTQPLKAGGYWVHGLWKNMVYVSLTWLETPKLLESPLNKIAFTGSWK